MEQPIYEGIDEIDSFDAYYANVHLGKTTLVIPYIDLALSKHPLNPTDRLKFLDFAYVVCRGLKYLKVQKGVLLGQKENAGVLLHFGGFPMDVPTVFVDFEVGCETAYLQPLPDSRLSDTFWVPGESRNGNLDSATVEAFFRGDRMPESIRQLVG